jgi:Uncharacterized bacitracin resistance protein
MSDPTIQALIMGIIQGLTEFLPISSSGHLIIVPFVLGWDDAFITSLAFSVMLHLGTLAALLAYFWADWVRVVPAGFAAVRDCSFGSDPDRRLAWLLLAATIPAALVGYLLSDIVDSAFHEGGPDAVKVVALTLVLGGVILWLADRFGRRDGRIGDVTFPVAIGIGAAQALALIPGISRSGISIAAARMAGLDGASAVRFSFLMATPITLGAVVFEVRRLVTGDAGAPVEVVPLLVGMVSSFVAGVFAIGVLLRYVRTHSLTIFVIYRFVLAGVVLAFLVTR